MRIAVLICSLVFDSQKALMKGIERRIRDWGDVCSVFCSYVNVSGSEPYLEGEYSVFKLPDLSSFDGIIFVRNTFHSDEAYKRLTRTIEELGKPCVCVDNYSSSFVNITSDETSIMEELTRHLIDVHDCKKIYYLSGYKNFPDSPPRFNGFMNALNKAGLPFKDEWCFYGTYELSDGINAANYFINVDETLPDAIVCANDEMAIGLMVELKRRGIKVPRDIKVTGVDFDTVSRAYTPRLTTVKRQQYQKGATAVNILHEYSDYHKGDSVSIPPSLYLGASCGCKPEDEGAIDITSVNALAVDRYAQSELTLLSKRMNADLLGVKDNDALLKALESYALEVGAEELYVCLNVRPDYPIDYSDYAKALALIDRENQTDFSEFLECSVAIIDKKPAPKEYLQMFNKDSLYPPMVKGGKQGGTYYFLPIHYMNRNFGYAILGPSGELVRNDYYPSWASIAGSALENSRKRRVMEQMISALDSMWIYDTLTGIYNRAGFFKLSESLINEAVRKCLPVCVIFLDVDGLKKVNDQFGHNMGDELIRGVADVLKNTKHHGELIMRYGGDEFVLLAPGYTEIDADARVEELENEMRSMNDIRNLPFKIDASIGYCITTLRAKEALNELIEDADKEMYIKKKKKKSERTS